eukprot:TRINITY_DN18255_c0_g1_i1.p1 TRINITY_DN18255_c0_g1~~TRINITY_DN18255_c0_g1_i1.p1  ORF type:complete len:234 (+),score=28.49 TRINITY_DN18255_c0_g1_i1:138-839(+)
MSYAPVNPECVIRKAGTFLYRGGDKEGSFFTRHQDVACRYGNGKVHVFRTTRDLRLIDGMTRQTIDYFQQSQMPISELRKLVTSSPAALALLDRQPDQGGLVNPHGLWTTGPVNVVMPDNATLPPSYFVDGTHAAPLFLAQVKQENTYRTSHKFDGWDVPRAVAQFGHGEGVFHGEVALVHGTTKLDYLGLVRCSPTWVAAGARADQQQLSTINNNMHSGAAFVLPRRQYGYR